MYQLEMSEFGFTFLNKSPTVEFLKTIRLKREKYNNSRGRYAADYEEMEMIGEGGFGRVYKVRNRVDNSVYAIKKMVIN